MTDTALSGPVPGILGAFSLTGPVPETIPDSFSINPWVDVGDNRTLLRVPHVARYLLEGGNKITIQAETDADPLSVEYFLHQAARGYLIHQRGEMPLDGVSLVAPNGAAIALSSNSGLGKSTLAVELCKRGWLLISDNITRVTLTSGRVLAWPSHNKIVLWRSAYESFAMDVNSLQPIRAGMDKFYVPVPSARGAAPLRVIVRILRGETTAQISDVPKQDVAALLPEWMFRWHQFAPINSVGPVHGTLKRMSETCRVVNLTGAREVAPFEMADLIERTVT